MGISTEKRFIYFVIPKTGSVTVRAAIDPVRDIKRPASHFSEHITIDRFLASPYSDLFDDYFKFTFVRNPYDRLYSGYMQDRFAAYNLDHWAGAKRPIFDRIGDDFATCVRDFVTRADIENDPFWICFCPMIKFTHRHGNPVMDWVGRNETFSADLPDLGRRLGLEIETIQEMNVRSTSMEMGRHLAKYDRATIEIVNSMYKDDFAAFDYHMIDAS